MPTVYVTRRIPDEGLKLLEAGGHRVAVSPHDRVLTKEELVAAIREHRPEALLCQLTDRIDGDVLDAGKPNLKIVANYAVGTDNIDLAAANARGVIVANTPGVLTDAVAEHTVALMFALARHITAADQYAKSGRYTGWDPFLFLGMELKGKTLGIVGLGRIGFGVAERCVRGMGMRVLYHDPKTNPDFERELGGQFRSLDDLLRESDIISIHVPLLPSTHHLINAERLGRMKPTALLINTSRGPIVDEAALLDALERKTIAGAALDVFECEPSITCRPDDHLRLKAMPNVILTPHIASATVEARQAMSRLAAENILAVLEGREPLNIVR
ncbi:D-glycerate dehydrogenase [Candidatus Uhrbacteria bacterium]|nr:D-glycerate dehydrogenase [Candidatus Uhrbacteria bacterium]